MTDELEDKKLVEAVADVGELGGDDDFFSDGVPDPKVPDTIEDELSTIPKLPTNSDLSLPDLRGLDFPERYTNLVERVQSEYRLLPRLNYENIYDELSELSVKSSPTPSLQVINDEIQKVQAAKDRLSEIFVDVYKCYMFKKRAVDILTDSWFKFSDEKSQDKRKADGTFRLSNFILDFSKNEGLLKACSHILKNLDSLHDSLSRRITIWQLTMKLQDVGRGNMPFDYLKPTHMVDEDVGIENEVDVNPSESKDAELEDF